MDFGRTEAARSLVAGNIVAEVGSLELRLVEDIRGKFVVEGIEVLVDSLERSR